MAVPSVSRTSEKVNTWFYTEWRDNVAPSNTAIYIFYEFTAAIKKKGLALSVHNNRFIHILCEALCTLYDAELQNMEVCGPTKRHEYVKDWNDELEATWIDYLQSRILNEGFWDTFWYNMGTADWEVSLPRWRVWMQSVLPFYIHRDIDLLVQEGLVFEDEDGHILNAEEALDAAEYEESFP